MQAMALIRLGLRNLSRSPGRSALAVLGVVIGVAAVVAMIGIGNGARQEIQRRLGTAESMKLIVMSKPSFLLPRSHGRRMHPVRLRPEDYRELRTEVRGVVRSTAVVMLSPAPAKVRGRSIQVDPMGSDIEGIRIRGSRLLSGPGFRDDDVRNARPVCVITQFLATYLFGTADVVGKTLQLSGQVFTVVGVATDEDGYTAAHPEKPGDVTVDVPYTTALRRLDRTAAMTIALTASSPIGLARMKEDSLAVLAARYPNGSESFVIDNVAEAVTRYTEGTRTMNALLGSVAAIALVVGGIGIMNIMLASVMERTREIGVRMAVGTRVSDIAKLFLVESSTLCVIGGILGIACGILSARLLGEWKDLPSIFTGWSVVVAFVCSAGVGLVFGLYPALRAARVDPIVALRTEL